MFKFITVFIFLLATSLSTVTAAPEPPRNLDNADTSGDWEDIYAQWLEAARSAPLDVGFGPGLLSAPKYSNDSAPAAGTIPNGGPNAAQQGVFGAPITWPIVAIHAALLPDGRVMTYGTDLAGRHGPTLIYDVWTPTLGTSSDSHMVLPNSTGSDIFCAAQTVLADSGALLTADGNLKAGPGEPNLSQNNTAYFDPVANNLTSGPTTRAQRWYPSLVPRADGSVVLMGGRTAPRVPALTPEMLPAGGTAWTLLPGATSARAFGKDHFNWYYPRAFTAPDGSIFQVGGDGFYDFNTSGQGSVTSFDVSLPRGDFGLPTAYIGPGQILSLRRNGAAIVVDINGAVPVVTNTGPLSALRLFSSGTIMADGEVAITGGSPVANVLSGASYNAELYNPATNSFSLAAAASKPRLYHSTALLLPDATILTAGGGAPGPITELNAEIYYPPYLYANDGSGNPAPRPSLLSVPSIINPGQTLTATVGPTDQIGQLTFIRTGSDTHSWNGDQRFFNLSFTQSGSTITATLPSNANNLLPGYYLLFAFNMAGTPSTAQIVRVVNW